MKPMSFCPFALTGGLAIWLSGSGSAYSQALQNLCGPERQRQGAYYLGGADGECHFAGVLFVEQHRRVADQHAECHDQQLQLPGACAGKHGDIILWSGLNQPATSGDLSGPAEAIAAGASTGDDNRAGHAHSRRGRSPEKQTDLLPQNDNASEQLPASLTMAHTRQKE